MIRVLEHLQLYKLSNIYAILISTILFLLFMVYYSFNFYNNINQKSDKKTSYWKFTLLYFKNGLKWIFKTILSNFTIFGLITIIILLMLMTKTLFSSEIHKINNSMINSSEIAKNIIQNDNYSIYKYYVSIITRYVLGIILLNPFIWIFLIIIPLFLFISTSSYLYILENEEEKDPDLYYITYTFFMTIFIGLSFLLYHYFIHISKE